MQEMQLSLGLSGLDTHPSSHPAQGVTEELPWQDLTLGVPGMASCLVNYMAVSTLQEIPGLP